MTTKVWAAEDQPVVPVLLLSVIRFSAPPFAENLVFFETTGLPTCRASEKNLVRYLSGHWDASKKS
jgi:hypothetical protein